MSASAPTLVLANIAIFSELAFSEGLRFRVRADSFEDDDAQSFEFMAESQRAA